MYAQTISDKCIHTILDKCIHTISNKCIHKCIHTISDKCIHTLHACPRGASWPSCTHIYVYVPNFMRSYYIRRHRAVSLESNGGDCSHCIQPLQGSMHRPAGRTCVRRNADTDLVCSSSDTYSAGNHPLPGFCAADGPVWSSLRQPRDRAPGSICAERMSRQYVELGLTDMATEVGHPCNCNNPSLRAYLVTLCYFAIGALGIE